MEELYQSNMDFRRYVDRYCNSYGYTVEEALKHVLVQEIAKEHKDIKCVGEDYKEQIMRRFTRVA